MKNYAKNEDGVIYQIEKSVIDYNENNVNTRNVS